MKTAAIEIGQYDAWRKYKSYRAMDRQRFARESPAVKKRVQREHNAAERIYFQISRGRTVIKLQESFELAGLDQRGWPKLAIERADMRFVWCRHRSGDTLSFGQLDVWPWRNRKSIDVRLPGHKVEASAQWQVPRAVVPTIPPHLLPPGKLERYHILWEAEWSPVAPKDPILLQHIDGDAWLVLAQWDLTEVERAVLQGRF